jgi:hypothetical protein
MIIVLEEIRTYRLQALRALRTLYYLDPAYEGDCQSSDPIQPGLKEAQEMLNSLPLAIWILPEDLPKFEEDFVVQSDQRMVPHAKPRYAPNPEPRAYIHFPDGMIAIYGDAKDLADAIYRLLGDGHLRDKIFVSTPGPTG